MKTNTTLPLAGQLQASEQWGYAQKPTSEYDFDLVYPIPFPTLVGAIMLTPQYEGQCRPHSINSFDRFSCSLRTDGTKPELNSNHVFAIGFQQWGKSLTAESKASVTFPIAFERIVYFVDVFSLDAGRPCLFTKSHPITTNGFYWEYNYHGDDVGVQWLAIGV